MIILRQQPSPACSFTHKSATAAAPSPAAGSASRGRPARAGHRPAPRPDQSGTAGRPEAVVAAEMSQRNSAINFNDDFPSIFRYQLSTVRRPAPTVPLSRTASGTRAIRCSYSRLRHKHGP